MAVSHGMQCPSGNQSAPFVIDTAWQSQPWKVAAEDMYVQLHHRAAASLKTSAWCKKASLSCAALRVIPREAKASYSQILDVDQTDTKSSPSNT